MTTFTDELALVGCYTDDHETDWDGDTYVTPSIINHDDRKEDHGEAQRAAFRAPRT